jgi:hypothetical protein
MKKAIMFIALVATSMVGAQAQKFQGGEKNLELNFLPFSDVSPIDISGIRFRMFNSESSAIRVGFDINGDKTTAVRVQPYKVGEVSKSELYTVTKDFGFSIRPGYEKHFAGTDRLSPYIGGEIVFSMTSNTISNEYHGGNTVDNAGAAKAAEWSTWKIEKKEGTTSFGVNALAGVDYYFADNFYLGAEMLFGFQSTKNKDTEFTVEEQAFLNYGAGGAATLSGVAETYGAIRIEGAPGSQKVVKDQRIGNKMTEWGPRAQATLRLGWLF